MARSARAAAVAALAILSSGLSGCGDPNDDDAWRSRQLFTTEGPIDPTLAPAPAEPADEGPRPLLVQFDARVRPEWRAAIEAAGARVRGYFPENALLVEATPSQARALAALPSLRAVVAQRAAWRIDPQLLRTAVSASADVIVEIDEARRAAVEEAIVRLGGSVAERPATWMLRASVPHDRLEAVAGVDGVRFVEKTPVFRPRNDEARFVLGAGDARASAHGLRGEGQIVALADSGVDTGSCFFASDDKFVAYEPLAGDEVDGNGHGTHVAGSIAGDRFGNGVADSYDGMAPAARLFVQDVGAGSAESLDAIPRDLANLLGPAYAAGARIHSDSWGTSSAVYGPTARSLDAFVATHPDLLVLVANGNDGPEPGTVGSPAVAKNVIAVGASGTGEFAGELAPFSSRGPSGDGRTKPTLVAPGAAIFSAAAGQDCAVVARSGTSMATPIAAGAATLVRQYFTDGYYPAGAATEAGFEPSAALLRAVLLAGAADLGEDAGEGAVPSNGQGFGRVDLGRSLWFAGDPTRERLWIANGDASRVGLGEALSWDVPVQQGTDLHVALAWTDVPGVSGAARALVQDLDLEVVAPDGTVYRGNGGRSWDRDDVEEVVHVRGAAAGNWTVRVHGANLPEGDQAFSLAVIGAAEDDGAVLDVPDPVRLPDAPTHAPTGEVPVEDDPLGALVRDAGGGCAAGGGAASLGGAALAIAALLRRRRR